MSERLCGYFDGASRGNPGEAGAGCCLVDESGTVVWERALYLGVRTNNEAEYTALIELLGEVKARGIGEIAIRGDSKLVVSQFRREWKIKAPHLRDYAMRAWELAKDIKVDMQWVPREHNKLADALSNRAIDERSV